MLVEMFSALNRSCRNMSRGTAMVIVLAAFIGGLALVLVGGFTLDSRSAAAVFLGSLGGILWVMGVHIAWWVLLPEDVQEKYGYRSRTPWSRRKMIMWWSGGIWMMFLILVNNSLAGVGWVAMGAVNVVVLTCLAHFGFADPDEREAWSEEQENKLREQMFAQALREGLINEEGEFIGTEEDLERVRRQSSLSARTMSRLRGKDNDNE